MKAKIYVGAKKYALYIGRKIIEKTLEFLTLPATFVSKKVQELKNLTMWGQSVQNGTPTPTAPVEIESVGDRTKNLFNLDKVTWGYNLDANGNFVVSEFNSYSDYIPCKPNTTYTVSFTVNILNSTTRYHCFDANKQWIAQATSTTVAGSKLGDRKVVTFTTSTNASYIVFTFRGASLTDTTLSTNIQLEEGSTATSYEPYGYKVPITVGGKNLFDKNNARLNYEVSSGTGIKASTDWFVSDYILVKPGQTYTFTSSGPRSGASYYLCKNYGDTGLDVGIIHSNPTLTEAGATNIAIPTGYNYLVFNGLISQLDGINIQVEEGNISTPYQHYIIPTTTNIYLNEPLRKIGDYADTLSVDGANVTVTRNVGVLGTEELANEFLNRGVASGTYVGSQYIPIYSSVIYLNKYNFGGINSSSLGNLKLICDKLAPLNTYFTSTTYTYGKVGVDSALNLYIDNTYASNREIMSDRIKNLNLEIILPLNAPTTETYTIDTPINIPQEILNLDVDTILKPTKIKITGDIDNA